MLPPPAPDVHVVPDWPVPANVRALVTTRTLPGNSRPPFDAFNLGLRSGEDIGLVMANRALLQRAFGLPSAPLWLHQVHGTDVLYVDSAPPAETPLPNEPIADAAVTRSGDIVLAVLTADCLPVLLSAADGSAVGVAHAGWRGLSSGVLEAAIARLGVPPHKVLAWLGPCIGSASYEVGVEVHDAFVRHDAQAESAFVPGRTGRWWCDLERLARQRVAAAGVAQVFGGGFDTVTDPRFYSWRRDTTRSGRFASLIWR